ncbi:LysR family transcriptional regulator [Pseudolabrys taiwanensis]|uniref:LysR family transcriptional regulator n=1 Tax=Pseudolabrys taiwanensis TaxID=331696 RepID=A0A345ZWB8_9HYPH|nr:LysR family transcriptional regulator [Pseudolabrys taiwanensis]AXK81215.1 LysR family transcriptional regulator [Pseudolabrys taiwanensis]
MLHARILVYLDEVARLGSIRRAATRLNVASSAINRQILALETQLGAPIFERMPRRLRLTATGEVLIAHVRETLKSHQRVTAQIEALKGLKRGEVTIATMNGIAAGPLPSFIDSIMASHPRVHIRVKVVPLDLIPNAVLTGDADIALGYNYPITPGLRVVASHDIHLGAVVAPNHPLTQRRPAWLADCLEYPLVIGDRSMTIRPIVDMAFTRAGLPLHPTIETNSIEFMSRIARAGRAVSFLNPVDVDVHTARGELVFIPFHDLNVEPVTMKLAVRARGTLDAFPSVLVEELRQAMPMLRRVRRDDE